MSNKDIERMQNISRQKPIKLWECQDCGSIEICKVELPEPKACWCSTDNEGVYHGKHERAEWRVVSGRYISEYEEK